MASPTKPKDMKPKAEGEAAAPPAGGGGGAAAAPPASGGLDMKFIILVVVMVVSSILGSAGSVYLMTSMLVTPEIQKLSKMSGAPGGEGEAKKEGGEEEAASNEVGMNLELDEFMINLKSDPALGGNQYLKAKMALSIKPPEKENCFLKKEKAELRRLPVGQMIAVLPPGWRSRLIAGAAAPVGAPVEIEDISEFDPTLLANEGEGGPPPCETEFKASMGRFVPTIRDVINSALMKRTASQLASSEGQETLKDEIKEQLSQMMAPEYEVLRVNFQDFIIQK
jgi:flagellar basal body-associated protein FliL